MGRFFEWEDQGMIARARRAPRARLAAALLRRQRRRGELVRQVEASGDRAVRHAQYDAYVRDEVLPLTQQRNSNPFPDHRGRELRRVPRGDVRAALSAAGRARDRAERLVRHPPADRRLFRRARSTTTIRPISCSASTTAARLDALRRLDIILAIGRDDPLRGDNEEFSRRLVVEGHRARAADLGWLVARLAVLARHDPARTSAATTELTQDYERMQKIGLIVGREWSFPPAFIEEVAKRDQGVIAEFVTLGGTAMDEPRAVRRDHRPHLARGAATTAPTSSTPCCRASTVVNNPFMWSADDKLFDASLATRLGVASPKTIALPNREYIPGINHDESLRNLQYPLDWQAIVDYIGMPCILKDAHGGGWKDVYVCRSLDELIHNYDDVRPADDDRAGVHRVGPVRPLPGDRPDATCCR